jgi:two-component system, chemotaxis family, chemotaxis protein CheY
VVKEELMAKKVLIVDDSSAIRQSISFVLQQSGYEVVEANDGLDGLEKLKASGPVDLIITDVNMPNMDGISMIKKVREKEEWKFLPIIVLTTESQGSKMNEGKEAGATGWIVKPFSAEKLLSVVKKVAG